MPFTQVALRGQVLSGSQYPGQHAGMHGLQQHPGQRLLVGSGSEQVAESVRDGRKCTKTREIDGVKQHCNGWAVKDRDPKLCLGHHRENDKAQALNDGVDSTADQGLR